MALSPDDTGARNHCKSERIIQENPDSRGMLVLAHPLISLNTGNNPQDLRRDAKKQQESCPKHRQMVRGEGFEPFRPETMLSFSESRTPTGQEPLDEVRDFSVLRL
jgi:hypothetical protein